MSRKTLSPFLYNALRSFSVLPDALRGLYLESVLVVFFASNSSAVLVLAPFSLALRSKYALRCACLGVNC